MKKKVLLLGSSGMLGSEILGQLGDARHLEVIPMSRNTTPCWNAERDRLEDLIVTLGLKRHDAIINASGWIPQRSTGDETSDQKNAWLMNVVVPRQLDSLAARLDVPLLQIGTDCVFSGLNPPYFESSPRDASDLYGVSKIEGEKNLTASTLVRCSIIGSRGKLGLFNWFQNLPIGQRVVGFSNQFWNGVSTLAFAKLSIAWLTSYEVFPRLQHWLPRNRLSKFDLLKVFARELGRSDLVIEEGNLSVNRDLTLATEDERKNTDYWTMAGYRDVPSIEELCGEFIGQIDRH